MAAHRKKKRPKGKKSAHTTGGQTMRATKWFWWILSFLAIALTVGMLWGTYAE